jgi:hypothetical protein
VRKTENECIVMGVSVRGDKLIVDAVEIEITSITACNHLADNDWRQSSSIGKRCLAGL